ncbi:hypothetical protein NN3_25860 [Nocardia neocaledoniensis NBRC 108232]|uniref:Uncharacterized protein n=1 Tax=Nocardia neocaledoniensis TaxID=236511 RepID=A0A317NS80_9NOCA|nr:hypothetical protein [Nocardia neocaledoniensis]PWV77743.1 hypothetical protein DFR69_103342 [Nocardia neocaledoniensis]GEM31579.1 hypothetical protein NN3_25860 [Nocardia neocaledoniensis NBRC 108232]
MHAGEFAAAAYRQDLRADDHTPDTWETYDAVAALLDEAWAEWRAGANLRRGPDRDPRVIQQEKSSAS